MLKNIKDIQENVEKLFGGEQFIAGDSLTVADHSFITIMEVLAVKEQVHVWQFTGLCNWHAWHFVTGPCEPSNILPEANLIGCCELSNMTSYEANQPGSFAPVKVTLPDAN